MMFVFDGDKIMTEEKVTAVLSIVSSKLPEEKVILFKNKLREAPERVYDDILVAQLKDPTHILLFSIFLGALGVDRFMLGDTGLGVGKLLLCWVTCGIWWLIDLFIVSNRAKEKNFNKLMLLL